MTQLYNLDLSKLDATVSFQCYDSMLLRWMFCWSRCSANAWLNVDSHSAEQEWGVQHLLTDRSNDKKGEDHAHAFKNKPSFERTNTWRHSRFKSILPPLLFDIYDFFSWHPKTSCVAQEDDKGTTVTQEGFFKAFLLGFWEPTLPVSRSASQPNEITYHPVLWLWCQVNCKTMSLGF